MRNTLQRAPGASSLNVQVSGEYWIEGWGHERYVSKTAPMNVFRLTVVGGNTHGRGAMRHRIAAVLLVAVALLTTLGWTGQCWAQAKVARIGFLTPASGGVWPEFVAALRALGYVENQTITFEVRAAGDNLDRLPELAAELVRSKVDIIVAVSPPAILAAKHATGTIPVVMGFWGGEGLLESGLVASFARPGGNVTGVYMLAAELDAKRLELLLEALPNARKVAVLNPGDGWTFTEVRRGAGGRDPAPHHRPARLGGLRPRL